MTQVFLPPYISITTIPTAAGFLGVIWDTDEETGAKMCLGEVETETRASAIYWARQLAFDIIDRSTP